MKRLLWVSQHEMHAVQHAVLKRMFGNDVQVASDPRPFDNAETIVRRFRDGQYDDCIVVAPLSVLAKMVDLGLRPLWADSEQVFDTSKKDWETKGRMYRFNGFKRVKRLVLDLEDLGPESVRNSDD